MSKVLRLCAVGAALLLGPATLFAAKPAPPPPPLTNPAISYATDQVYVMKANGTQNTQLTRNKGGKGHTAWSPSGSRIAYINSIIDKVHNTVTRELWAVNANGSNNVKLCSVENAANNGIPDRIDWSPDGNWIVLMQRGPEPVGADDLYAVNANDCRTVRLTYNAQHVYSWPFGDTGMTAYGHGTGGSPGQSPFAPTWSPDLDPGTPGYQTRVAFTEFSCLYLRPDGSGFCEWFPEGGERSVNFDVMTVAVNIVGGELLVDADQIPVPLGPIDDGEPGIDDDLSEYSGDWDASGSWLIHKKIRFQSWPTELLEGQYKVSADGSQELILWSGTNDRARWSPDSLWYATDGVYRVRNDPANPAPTFLRAGSYVDWNPAWVNDIGN